MAFPFAQDVVHLQKLLVSAYRHSGFSLLTWLGLGPLQISMKLRFGAGFLASILAVACPALT